jgi:hypothetical protein
MISQAPAAGNQTILQFLTSTLTDDGSLTKVGSPQNLALAALQTNFPKLDPNNGPTDQKSISEIYALNTLYFSSNGTNWLQSTDWTGPKAVCTPWLGVTCDAAKVSVTGVNLTKLELSGTIPSEIRGLRSLGT